jgi:hypothetical protein
MLRLLKVLLCLCLATSLMPGCGDDEPPVPTFDVRSSGDVGSTDVEEEEDEEEEVVESRCSDHSECSAEELCLDSRCVDRDDALSDCVDDDDCPDDFHCVDQDYCEED